MAVRERNGLVYSIDSLLTYYTDIGYWCIYFGCDKQNYKKCISLIYNELEKLQKTKISEYRLKKAKEQFSGHRLIISQNKENQILAMARSVLHYNHFYTKEEVIKIIQKISAADLHLEAQRLFDFDKLTVLKFT
jgi:predicted Zn-dependent peptidase